MMLRELKTLRELRMLRELRTLRELRMLRELRTLKELRKCNWDFFLLLPGRPRLEHCPEKVWLQTFFYFSFFSFFAVLAA